MVKSTVKVRRSCSVRGHSSSVETQARRPLFSRRVRKSSRSLLTIRRKLRLNFQKLFNLQKSLRLQTNYRLRALVTQLTFPPDWHWALTLRAGRAHGRHPAMPAGLANRIWWNIVPGTDTLRRLQRCRIRRWPLPAAGWPIRSYRSGLGAAMFLHPICRYGLLNGINKSCYQQNTIVKLSFRTHRTSSIEYY